MRQIYTFEVSLIIFLLDWLKLIYLLLRMLLNSFHLRRRKFHILILWNKLKYQCFIFWLSPTLIYLLKKKKQFSPSSAGWGNLLSFPPTRTFRKSDSFPLSCQAGWEKYNVIIRTTTYKGGWYLKEFASPLKNYFSLTAVFLSR